jgi:hypothetical protein
MWDAAIGCKLVLGIVVRVVLRLGVVVRLVLVLVLCCEVRVGIGLVVNEWVKVWRRSVALAWIHVVGWRLRIWDMRRIRMSMWRKSSSGRLTVDRNGVGLSVCVVGVVVSGVVVEWWNCSGRCVAGWGLLSARTLR